MIKAQKQLRKQAKTQASKAGQGQRQLGPLNELTKAQSELKGKGVSIPDLLQKSFVASLTFGTAFQVTHNNGLLPV